MALDRPPRLGHAHSLQRKARRARGLVLLAAGYTSSALDYANFVMTARKIGRAPGQRSLMTA